MENTTAIKDGNKEIVNAPPSIPFKLSDYSILGYGYDIISDESKEPIAKFTYSNSQKFTWNGKDILIPDQITYSETPSGSWGLPSFASIVKNSRAFQRDMAVKVGLSIKNPETNMIFAKDSVISNEMFTQKDSKSTLHLFMNHYYFSFLQFKSIHLANNLLDDVRQAIIDCQKSPEKIKHFYDTYGTYVVKSAGIGGQLQVRTSIKLDVQSNKEMSTNGVKFDVEVKQENNEFLKGNLKFSDRSQSTSKLYRKVSRVAISLLGGEVTADNQENWRKTLDRSDIPTQGSVFSSMSYKAPGFAASLSGNSTQNLALINLQYVPIYEALHFADHTQKTAFVDTFNEHMKGVNPFHDDVQRLVPEMDSSKRIANKKGSQVVFTMRGWAATYETYAGLKAAPGNYVVVECKSNAEPGGWTRKKIYAGEEIQLRGKTAYFSKYMHVRVVQPANDPGAKISAENRLVTW